MNKKNPKAHAKAGFKINAKAAEMVGRFGLPPDAAKIKTPATWLFDTMASCAAYTGTPQEILKAAKKAGCRGFKLGNRVDFLEVLRWYWMQGGVKNELPTGFASWREYGDKQVALLKKDALDKIKKDSMSYAEGKRQAATAVAAVIGEQARMEQEFPPLVQGMAAEQIAAELKKYHGNSREKWQADFERIGEREGVR